MDKRRVFPTPVHKLHELRDRGSNALRTKPIMTPYPTEPVQ